MSTQGLRLLASLVWAVVLGGYFISEWNRPWLKVDAKPDLEEGECPECEGDGHLDGERCYLCRGAKWVKPSPSGYHYWPTKKPDWAAKEHPHA